jgi:Na+/H+ antiporter NhaA
MQQTNQQVTDTQISTEELKLGLLIGIAFSITIGVVLSIFSVTYLRDLETLRNVPDAIWSFVCGKPVEGGITLPLLLTLTVMSFLSSGLLAIWHWRIND